MQANPRSFDKTEPYFFFSFSDIRSFVSHISDCAWKWNRILFSTGISHLSVATRCCETISGTAEINKWGDEDLS